jgi:hypothetical protein
LDVSWNCCARCAYLYGNYSHEGSLIRWVCGCSDDEDTATARVSTTSSSPQSAPGVIINGNALVNVPFRLHSSLLPVSHPLVASFMCHCLSCKVQCVSFRKEHMTIPFSQDIPLGMLFFPAENLLQNITESLGSNQIRSFE